MQTDRGEQSVCRRFLRARTRKKMRKKIPHSVTTYEELEFVVFVAGKSQDKKLDQMKKMTS